MLLAANHQSFIDPPLAGISVDRPIHYLGRKTLFDNPIMSWFLERLNVVPVDRDGADMSALKTVIRLLRSGCVTLIFPEGTRTTDGNLQPARPGIGLVIAKTLVPVLPMRIFGTYEAWPKGQKYPGRSEITVVIGKPLRFTKEDTQGDLRVAYQRISDRVMEAIAALENPRRD